MGIGRLKPTKNEIAERAWNPITGCNYNCPYCKARKITINFSGDMRLNMSSPQCEHTENGLCILESKFITVAGDTLSYPFQFRPTYHRYRLDHPKETKNGYNVLVGEMGETFGEWIPDSWLKEIFKACEAGEQNNYLFLTKNPRRYRELDLKGVLPDKDNFWYGITVTGAYDPVERLPGKNLWLNFEPLRESPGNEPDLAGAAWVVIGGDTMKWSGQIQPRRKWIQCIVKEADLQGIPVFMKDSIRDIVGTENMRKEFPKSLVEGKYISQKIREKLEGSCMGCGAHVKKNSMVALCGRYRRGRHPKQFGFLCRECFEKQCKIWNITVPEMEGGEEIDGE